MSQWYVKEFSTLTGVSVRMLHHYDAVGLLKPSLRTDADYRVYTAADLLRLQQIVALRSFGLSLKEVGSLMANAIDAHELLAQQRTALKQQVREQQKAIKLLDAIIEDGAQSQSVEVETILQLIRVYNMKKDLKKTWVGKLANAEQFDRIVDMAKRHPDDKYNAKLAWVERVFTEDERARLIAHFAKRDEKEVLANEEQWHVLLAAVQEAIGRGVSPKSEQARDLVKQFNALLDDMYGNEPVLRTAAQRVFSDVSNIHPEMPKAVAEWLAKVS